MDFANRYEKLYLRKSRSQFRPKGIVIFPKTQLASSGNYNLAYEKIWGEIFFFFFLEELFCNIPFKDMFIDFAVARAIYFVPFFSFTCTKNLN